MNIFKRLIRAITKGVVMAKEDVVAAAVSAIQAGEQQVLVDQLGAVYEQAQAEKPEGGGVDQAIVDGLNAQIADLQARELALQSKFDSDELLVADLNAKLLALQSGFDQLKVSDDALVAKEAGEAVLIKGFSDAKQTLADILAALNKVGAPDPAPIPDPAPVDPAPVEPDPAA